MNARFRQFPLWAAGLLFLCAGFPACRSPEAAGKQYAVPRFYLEADPSVPAGQRETAVLPVSGAEIPIQRAPFLTENDIAAVALAQVDLGLCLLFSIIPEKASVLHEVSAENRGRRLVLKIGGRPAGVRVMNEPVTGGRLFTFVEAPETELAVLANQIQSAIRNPARTVKEKARNDF